MPEADIRAHLFGSQLTNLAGLGAVFDMPSSQEIAGDQAMEALRPAQHEAYVVIDRASRIAYVTIHGNYPASVPLWGSVFEGSIEEARQPDPVIHVRSVWSAHDAMAHQTTQAVSEVLQANWAELAKSGLGNVSFERLQRLGAKTSEWRGPGSRPLQASSLRAALKFWDLVRSAAREPEFMLTPRGTLQAEWHKSYRQFLDVEFKTDGEEVNFGLFDRGRTLEGVVSIEEARNVIVGYRRGIALQWG